jgi:hypothetical protein
LAVVLALLAAVPAGASFEGTPGKVAYLLGDEADWQLRLWDPVTEGTSTVEPTTWDADNMGTGHDVHGAEWKIGAGDVPSAPSWSPDGSQFAYAKRIDDPGDFEGLQHSAIFVHTVATGQTRQVTEPQSGVLDKVPEDPPYFGHVVSDFAPAWSSDGNTIAFIRRVQALGPDDQLYDKRGQNLWRVPADGPASLASQVTTVPQESGRTVSGPVWIPGTQDVVVSYFTPSFEPALGRVSIGGGNPSRLAGFNGQAVSDYDVSPDGKTLVYGVLGAGGVTPFVQPLSGGPGVAAGSGFGAIVRFAGTGDGLLHSDCTTRTSSVCGLVNHLTSDPGADIDTDEPDRLALAWNVPAAGTGAQPGRMAFDVQAQELPVIFLPGFLGTRIQCGAKEEWPSIPFPDLLPMSLNADGVTDAGCQPTAVLETVGPSDVYGKVAAYVRSKFGTRGTLFGWDWRKRPQPSFVKLETAIDDALARDGPWKKQQAGRVVLWGHSYGGLFIRAFIEGSGGDRVARVLTVGTPYWGSPKSIFPLAFGVETPEGSAVDAMVNNDRLKGFAKNLSGLYNLYPSAHYPPWLSVNGALQNQSGVSAFLGSVGGNPTLFNQASADHQNVFDGFYDNGGRIDVRAVVGTGLNTISGVRVNYRDDGTFEDVNGTFDNGDETVPGRSGAQGPLNVKPPLGDPVHVQYTCGVSHVPLPAAPNLLQAYEAFLKTGAVPRKLPPACGSAGGSYRFAPGSIGRTDPQGLRSGRAGGALDLDTAEQQGLADVLDLGPATLVVVNDRRPATLRVPITNGTFTYTPLTGDKQGAVATYGPVTGTLELAPGAKGAPPAVTVNGKPLAPHAPPAGPPPAAPAPPAGAPPPASGPPAAPARFALVGRPRLRGRTLTLVLKLPAAGRLALRATAKRGGRTRALGALRKRIPAAGRRTLKLKLKRRPPAKLRLAIAFTPTGGVKQTRTLTVKRRR